MLCGVKSIGSSIRRSGWEMGVTIFISLDCCKINDIFYVKYLTSCLTWRSHITKKIKDVKKKIFFFLLVGLQVHNQAETSDPSGFSTK